MKTLVAVVTAALLVGCVVTAGAQTVGTPDRYFGEVWTWDSGRSIVTLYDTGRQFRVQVTPDQIARLRLHDNAVVTGILLGPEPIETVMRPVPPMVALPNGVAMSAEVDGQITGLDPKGLAVIDSARGPLRVWLADDPHSRFTSGHQVKVLVAVQPVQMVAVSGGGGLASRPTITTPAPVQGDQAIVVGRILSVSSTGALAIDSPRGPIGVWVPAAASFKPGDYVQVQTVVQPSSVPLTYLSTNPCAKEGWACSAASVI